MEDLKTSSEWYPLIPQEFKFKLLDPDGWDRRNWDWSWNQEKITKDEFKMRLARSTISCPIEFFNINW